MRRKKAIQISQLLGSPASFISTDPPRRATAKWEYDTLYQVQYVPSFESSKLVILPLDLH